MKRTIIILSLVLLAFSIYAQEMQFAHSFEEAITTARKENKLIFMDAYTTWCGPCKKMNRDVFVDGIVGTYYNNNFINLKVNMEKGEGIALAQKYAVNLYPTLLFLNGNGEVIHRSAGYHNPEQFIELGQIANDPGRQLSNLEKRFKSGEKDPEFLAEYSMRAYEAMNNTHEAPALAYLETQTDWNSEVNMEFIYRMVNSIDNKMFDFLKSNQEKFEILYSKKDVEQKIEGLIYQSIYNLGKNPNLPDVDKIFKKAYPEIADKLSTKFRMKHYMINNDAKMYRKNAKKYFKKYPPVNPDEWNEEAWNVYELLDDKKSLKCATKWAKKSIKIEERFYNMDTLAALYYKLGKKGKAEKAAKRAIELANSSGEDPSLTEELLEKINQL